MRNTEILSFAQNDDRKQAKVTATERQVLPLCGRMTRCVWVGEGWGLSAWGGWDHYGVGIYSGDAEVAAEVEEVEGTEVAT